MLSRMFVLLLLLMSILTGCTKSNNSNLTLEHVTQSMKDEGLQFVFIKQSGEEFSVLNKVKPSVFTINRATREEDVPLESFNVYIFDSEKARISGLKKFKQQLERTKLTTFPLSYEKKNVLVIYFSEKREGTIFGNKIKQALQNL